MRDYMSKLPENFFSNLSANYEKHNYIDPEYYNNYNYNIKRGLRNADGTGVTAGLTQICNVHGYLLNEGERMPIPGELTYRGYSIDDLVANCVAEDRFGFEETAYLLMVGHLPNQQELAAFNEAIGLMRYLPKHFTEDMIMRMPSRDIMNNLSRAVLALYSFDQQAEDYSVENNLRQSIELFARFPIIVSYAYQAKKHFHDKESLYVHFLQPGLSTAENILHLIRKDSSYTKEEARLLDLALILHAEHGGGNNSTFTSRVLTSAGTDIYSSIAASVGALKGHKHGGANMKVVDMIENIKDNVQDWADDEEIAAYLRKILNKEAGDRSGLIYGMGHAVYTLSDPRAVILRKNAQRLAEQTNRLKELELLDRIAALSPILFNETKKQKKIICPNVDFYSGFVYSMLGIPREMYTALFAIARISGWCAHRTEELVTGGRIMRPAYKSVVPKMEYVPIYDRK